MKKVLYVSLLFLSACAIRSVTPGDTLEVNMDFDLAALDMRHGLQLLTPPELKYVGIDDKKSEQRGQKLFVQHCQKCHGPKGFGNGPLAEKMKIKPANLTEIDLGTTNTYLVVQINKGRGDMPAWQDFLTEKEMFDLTNYIRTLSK